MNRHQVYAVVVCFLALVVSANVANAQSKDRDNPTRLPSNEISGVIDSDSIGNSYYYSFTANRGEVSITLTVESGRQVKYGDFTLSTVSFKLFNRQGEVVVDNGVATGPPDVKYYTAKTNVPQRQIMVLRVEIPSGMYNNAVGGKYRIQINGAVEFHQSEATTGDPQLDEAIREAGRQSRISNEKAGKPECLPKQGTLIIKMKDGSKKIIDLSEAETITVVP
jgi:hypothetical protein